MDFETREAEFDVPEGGGGPAGDWLVLAGNPKKVALTAVMRNLVILLNQLLK